MPSLAEDLGMRAGALATAMLVAVAGCGGGLPGAQGDAAAPVLVSGRVVDAAGAPVGGAPIQLVVNDYGANIPVGGVVPNVFQASFTANVDGSFAIHLAPPRATTTNLKPRSSRALPPESRIGQETAF